ncbi:MAG: putative sulfate exporter family transporter [Muribaculaceae bacterium]|nr:putative sulfate exporter family transporter [Muribaculaceae bacterium]
MTKSIDRNMMGKALYWLLLVVMILPLRSMFGLDSEPISPPVALFVGLIFALCFGAPCQKFNKKLSKQLLQASVVGLGFGMNLVQSLKSGAEGMLFTIISVALVMIVGVWLGRRMRIEQKTSYLISSGTAICGGSAIAAVGGVLKANENQMAVSLGVVFILNAIALFVFPPIGRMLGMSDGQFGTWAAIAIHDTSSVVGAGQAYSATACEIATLVKCTRALWIIPLAFFTAYLYRNDASATGKTKIAVPWFIVLFVVAMVVNTYTPESLTSTMQPIYQGIAMLAKRMMTVVLFAIGAGLSLKVVRQVGLRPLVLAVVLWIVIGIGSLLVVINTIE